MTKLHNILSYEVKVTCALNININVSLLDWSLSVSYWWGNRKVVQLIQWALLYWPLIKSFEHFITLLCSIQCVSVFLCSDDLWRDGTRASWTFWQLVHKLDWISICKSQTAKSNLIKVWHSLLLKKYLFTQHNLCEQTVMGLLESSPQINLNIILVK